MVLRPGNAGSNTAADHLVVLCAGPHADQGPVALQEGLDQGRRSHALITALAQQGLDFSVGYRFVS